MSGVTARHEPPASPWRALAYLGAVLLFSFGVIRLWVALIAPYRSWDDPDIPLQLIGLGVAVAAFAGAGLAWRFARSSRGLGLFVLALAATAALLVLWEVGFDTWCDGCGPN
jgi:hypothetical protein